MIGADALRPASCPKRCRYSSVSRINPSSRSTPRRSSEHQFASLTHRKPGSAQLYGVSEASLNLSKIANWSSGTQRVHTSSPRGGVQTVRDVVQSVLKEVSILVERHRRGLVTEHLLHDLHVGAGRDRRPAAMSTEEMEKPFLSLA